MSDMKPLYVTRDEYALLLRLMQTAESMPMLQLAMFVGLVKEQCAPEILEELLAAIKGGYQLRLHLMPVEGPLCQEACVL